MTESFEIVEGGSGCIVTIGEHVVSLTARDGQTYVEADGPKLLQITRDYLAGHADDTNTRIIVRSWFGRQWLVRVDHSPPAWHWPSIKVSRSGRWIGVGWRLTLVQLFLPKRVQP